MLLRTMEHFLDFAANESGLMLKIPCQFKALLQIQKKTRMKWTNFLVDRKKK